MHRRLRGTVLTLAVIATCLLAFAGPAVAIQFGQPDGDSHPYVCLVQFYDEAGEPLWFTTGELISSRVVLTAGHGTSGADSARVWFSSEIPQDSPDGYPFGGEGSYRGTPNTNPDFRWSPPKLPTADYHDVGVVVLDKEAPVDVFAQLPPAGIVATLRAKHPVDVVGYGMNYQANGPGPADWQWLRQRQWATSTIVQTKSVFTREFVPVAVNPGKQNGGGAPGDSGCPTLDRGTDTVLAIQSFGESGWNCMGVTFNQRIDLPDILAWIEGFITD